ncbi:MAG: UPF0149 family protein [Nevskiales bacterium]
MDATDYTQCERALRSLGLTQPAAEYHGILCGMLCHGEVQDPVLGLEPLGEISAGALPLARDWLRELRSYSLTRLHDAESGFLPLLPEDSAALPQRVEALAQWCEGFLFGLATQPGLQLESLSAEARELVEDFTQISRAGLSSDEPAEGESEEQAYTELVEYVRVGVQLIFLELRPRQHAPAISTTLH